MRKSDNKQRFVLLFVVIIYALLSTQCKHEPDMSPGPESCDTSNISFAGTIVPILENNCYACHNSQINNGGVNLQDFNTISYLAENGILSGVINRREGYTAMPPNYALDMCDVIKIDTWINDTTFYPPGGGDDHPCDPDTVYFENHVLPLIISSCATTDCHDKLTDEQDVLLIDYSSIINYGDIVPGNPDESKLYRKITETDPDDVMPPPPNGRLYAGQIAAIRTWIEQGALNNKCDEACDTTNVTFSGNVWPIIELNCTGCHSGANPAGNIRLTDYSTVVVQANTGKLFGAINHDPGFVPMPRNAPQLAPCKIDQIRIWIEDGTPDN